MVLVQCLRCSSVLVVILAVALGSGFLGGFSYLDQWRDSRNNTYFMGMIPWIHSGPWQFTHSDIPRLEGKTILVTGANAGLGYWTAYHLANKGAHVVLGCRSKSTCDTTISKLNAELPQEGSLECLVMDLASLKSVKVAATTFKSKHSALHSLILNAGIMRVPFGLTEDGIEQQIAVNHFGHALLTRELQDLLIQTAATNGQPTTVVVLSSCLHFSSYPEGVRLSLDLLNDPTTYDSGLAYGQSKLANVLYAQELSHRLSKHSVLVNSLHPGGVKTEISRHVVASWHVPSVVWETIYGVGGLLIWSASDAALTQIYAAVSPDVLSRGVTGKYFHPIARETTPDLHARNHSLQTKFWAFTEEVLSKY